MIMITGGAYQGKNEYVKKRFDLSDSDILDGGTDDLAALDNAKCVRHYELAVKRLLDSGEDPLSFTERLSCNIVIMNEIGCGIIPLEKKERVWREMTGRCGCMLAGRAEEVVRVCCGIAEVIKGEKN